MPWYKLQNKHHFLTGYLIFFLNLLCIFKLNANCQTFMPTVTMDYYFLLNQINEMLVGPLKINIIFSTSILKALYLINFKIHAIIEVCC